MEEENDISSIVKKIQILEDDLFPSLTKELKEMKIQNKKQVETDEKFNINPKYCEVFSNKLKKLLNETDFFEKQFPENLEKLCKVSFNSSLDLPKKDLIISSPTKMEADILHKFDKIIIENGGHLSIINP